LTLQEHFQQSCRMSAGSGETSLPPCGGDARQGRGGCEGTRRWKPGQRHRRSVKA
jgi:hypothetical protein